MQLAARLVLPETISSYDIDYAVKVLGSGAMVMSCWEQVPSTMVANISIACAGSSVLEPPSQCRPYGYLQSSACTTLTTLPAGLRRKGADEDLSGLPI